MCFDKSRNKWGAHVCKTNLGRFEPEKEAARAYNEAAKEYFGEFAKSNVIEDFFLIIEYFLILKRIE